MSDGVAKTHGCENPVDHNIRFLVGEEKQLLLGDKSKMADVSPIFDAMFRGCWKEEKEVEIPDVHPDALQMLLRHAEGQGELGRSAVKLTERTVWDVLKAADKYQVLPVVRRCFHFLLHTHSCRHSGQHLSAVLELAHQLNHQEEYAQCLDKVKRRAGKVLKSGPSLTQLCHDCLLNVVRADDLRHADEVVVHEAVMTWTRSLVRRQQGVASLQPTREQMRAVAGDLVHHVRYLTLPRPTLLRLVDEESASCLLTADEVDDLLNHGGSQFPASVRKARKADSLKRKATAVTRKKYVRWCVLVVLTLLLTFVIQYLLVRFLVSPMVKGLQQGTDADPKCKNQTLCGSAKGRT